VGFYTLAYQGLAIPMTIIGKSIAQVYFQSASQENYKNDLSPVTEIYFRHLVMLGIFPLITLLVAGPDIFLFVFGLKWAESGQYIILLCPWIFFVFISSPLSTIFIVTEKQPHLFLFNIVSFFLRLLSLLIGGWIGNPFLTVFLLGATGASLYFWLCLWNLKKAKIDYRTSIVIIFRYFLLTVPSLSILLYAKYSQFAKGLVIVVIPFALFLFILTIFKFDRNSFRTLQFLPR
jgi:O-antigen/teichoic acid export membrane protein